MDLSDSWDLLLTQELEDSRQQNPVPVQEFTLDREQEIRYLKFEVTDFWGVGGGLQFLDIIEGAPNEGNCTHPSS